MNHLNAIHDTAIRLNSLSGMPRFVGRNTNDTMEARSFSKAIVEALDGGITSDAILDQLQRSLGTEERASGFCKAHVQQHFRNVNGKMILVHDHESDIPTHHADGMPNLNYIHALGMKANGSSEHGHYDAVIAASQAAADWHSQNSKAHGDADHKMASYYEEGVENYKEAKSSLPV
jgi:hypothetical protein